MRAIEPRTPAALQALTRRGIAFAANERTFLAWLSMATTLGTVGTAIAGFAVEDESTKTHGAISHGTVELITTLLLPISIAMIGYALFVFYHRSEFIRKKQVCLLPDFIVCPALWSGMLFMSVRLSSLEPTCLKKTELSGLFEKEKMHCNVFH